MWDLQIFILTHNCKTIRSICSSGSVIYVSLRPVMQKPSAHDSPQAEHKCFLLDKSLADRLGGTYLLNRRRTQL